MSEPRRPLLAGNWKMHGTHLDAIRLTQALGFRLGPAELDHVDVSLHPPFTSLRSVQTVIDADDLGFALGAQDCYFEDEGAFTGEVSPLMLVKLQVRYVIVGHSERRRLMGESDETVAKKLQAVLRAGMTPILCVGEDVNERNEGKTQARLTDQVTSALGNLGASVGGEKLVIAYEPVWAIGSGQAASPEDAEQGAALIRSVAAGLLGDEAAGRIRILYGGSVTPDSVGALVGGDNVDGALVGGASLDADTFSSLVKEALKVLVPGAATK